MADHVTIQAQPASECASTVASTSDYSPSVGDVVEFEVYFSYGKQRAILGHCSGYCSNELTVFTECGEFNVLEENSSDMAGMRKIGFSDTEPCSMFPSIKKGRDFAKAYFAQPPAKFKVGDRVKVIEKFYSLPVGTITEIKKIDSDGDIWLVKDNNCYGTEMVELAAPTFTGSYAERQKQWVEYHGLEVGSKVRVVRKWEDNEGGYNGGGRDSIGHSASILTIQGIDGIQLSKQDDSCCTWFHYKALEPVK